MGFLFILLRLHDGFEERELLVAVLAGRFPLYQTFLRQRKFRILHLVIMKHFCLRRVYL